MTGPFAMDAGPDFFVIGAQRAGTTRLCRLLDSHPNIVIPTKEPMFFHSADDMAAKAAWYRDLFAAVPGGAVKGDGSTYYSMCGIYPGTAQRVYEFNPNARIIYMARHPLRRIESAWVQLLSVGQANRVRGFDGTLKETSLLMDPSLYWKQISEYRRYFADEQISLHFFEEFSANERAVVESCCAFLGVAAPLLPEVDDIEARNESLGKRQRSLVVDAARELPRYDEFKSLIPQRVKSFFSEHFTSPIPTTIKWRPDTRAWAINQLKEDSWSFLDYAGQDLEYWPLE